MTHATYNVTQLFICKILHKAPLHSDAACSNSCVCVIFKMLPCTHIHPLYLHIHVPAPATSNGRLYVPVCKCRHSQTPALVCPWLAMSVNAASTCSLHICKIQLAQGWYCISMMIVTGQAKRDCMHPLNLTYNHYLSPCIEAPVWCLHIWQNKLMASYSIKHSQWNLVIY